MYYKGTIKKLWSNPGKGDETEMSGSEKNTGTFIVKVLDRQNATWQGSVIWVEEHRERYFRSALELLKMIDGALDEDEEEKKLEKPQSEKSVEGGYYEA